MYLIPNPEPATLDDIAVYFLDKQTFFNSNRNQMRLPNFIQGWLDTAIEKLPQYCITFEVPLCVILKNLDEVPNLDHIVWAYGDGHEERFTRGDIDANNKLTSFHTYSIPAEYTQTLSFYSDSNQPVGDPLSFNVQAKQCYVRANVNARSYLDNAQTLEKLSTRKERTTKRQLEENKKSIYIKIGNN